MSLKMLVKTFILAIALSTITITLAESAERTAPAPPPSTGLLAVVGDGFIVSGERKYLVNSKTVIKNIRGQTISVRLLKVKSRLEVEFMFIEKNGAAVPLAKLIKVLTEP